ncbi:MAG: DUF397 domain-containing protein [Labedaea sp.]
MTNWQKSSFSSNGNACVEVAWRKSSFTTGDACVEVAAVEIGVLVRDSKNGSGPTIAFSRRAWSAALLGAPALH